MKRHLFIMLIVPLAFSLVDASLAPRQAYAQEEAASFVTAPLDEEEKESVLARIKREHPEVYNWLLFVEVHNREQYTQITNELVKFERIMRLCEQYDPDRYQRLRTIQNLSFQERLLAEQYKKANSEEEKRALKKRIMTEVLEKLFDLKLEERTVEVKELEEKLRKIKEEIAQREKRKKEILEQHFEEITGQLDYMQW